MFLDFIFKLGFNFCCFDRICLDLKTDRLSLPEQDIDIDGLEAHEQFSHSCGAFWIVRNPNLRFPRTSNVEDDEKEGWTTSTSKSVFLIKEHSKIMHHEYQEELKHSESVSDDWIRKHLFLKAIPADIEHEFKCHYLLTRDNESKFLLRCYGKFDAPMISDEDLKQDISHMNTKSKVDELLRSHDKSASMKNDTSTFIVTDLQPFSLYHWCE